MIISPLKIVAPSCLAMALALAPPLATAATAASALSVAKVLDLFDTVESDPEAGKLLFAYLSGVGETAGILVEMAGQYGASLSCTSALTLDGDTVQSALRRAGGAPETRDATPVIIEDMFRRAGCD